MSKTVLGLFQSQTQLNQAINELRNEGFQTSQMRTFYQIGNRRGGYQIATIGTNEDDRSADMKSELFQTLIKWNVPKDDAFVFTEGVRHGGKMIALFTDDDKTDQVKAIFKRNEAIDLNARKKFFEEQKQKPIECPKTPPYLKIVEESKFNYEFAHWMEEHQKELGEEAPVRVYEAPAQPKENPWQYNLNE